MTLTINPGPVKTILWNGIPKRIIVTEFHYKQEKRRTRAEKTTKKQRLAREYATKYCKAYTDCLTKAAHANKILDCVACKRRVEK